MDEKPKYKRPRTQSLKDSQLKYDRANTRHFGVKLNTTTDADILARIDEAVCCGETVQGYIKRCIRLEMQDPNRVVYREIYHPPQE